MDEQAKQSVDGVEIQVSSDQLSVMLHLSKGATASLSEIIRRLRDLKIARFDDGIIIEALEQSRDASVSIEVAKGTASVDDQPGKIEHLLLVSKDSTSLVTKVDTGQIIANIGPVMAGTDGTDVFGKPLERKKHTAIPIGRNLIESNGRLTTQLKGNLRLIGETLSVEPLLELRGDTDNVAPITFEGDAVIRGSINEGRIVQITGCLTVAGAVEAIQLTVGGSVVVNGGITGNQKGRYTIGGDVRCRFVSGGFIIAGQDVHIQSNVSDARIACGGKLQVAQGIIFGGVIAANSGLSCPTLGHPGGVPTLIEAGEGIASRSFLATAAVQITTNQKRIKTIRAKIAPLLRIMKTLSAQQREKATELLYEADELELATEKLIAELKTRTRELHEKAHAEVVVSKIIHPGVTVRFPNAKTVFNTAVKGPFTLIPQTVDGVTKIILVDGTDQSTTVLPTSPVTAAASVHAEPEIRKAA